jgi:hypothetical protein
MTDLAQTIGEWETFYLLTGTAAATLIGLLFVAVSIHIDTFHKEAYGDLQQFAALTFNSFFYVLVMALLFLIPGLSALGLGLPLLLLGLAGVVNGLWQQRRARRFQVQRGRGHLTGRFVLPILCQLGMAVVAAFLIAGVAEALYALTIVVVLLLASAAVNAWTLLMRPEDMPNV